ncbi:uncharacterized protein BX663DRAFT_515138 [Cokeromyces recurvatus]|uniref:uncharacterized protein n=1 Tax=Cokeromyces recurvatus TaxID=90255 RepID=UPI00221F0B98|nr:uncharacterized protein BX663DRAFT_515138 [Cokeromyces recurvatus]KAI7901157.1 hypothetical protein BX663DRAFT_515138 [Cokeromyces recurvatus]
MEIGPTSNNLTTCSSQACIEIAKSILDDIDFNIDPCSDFYQYTCGNWLKRATIAEDRASNGTFEETNDIIIDAMHTILEGNYEEIYQSLSTIDTEFHTQEQEAVDKENFGMMKTYYDTCMNLTYINSLGPTPIYEDIAVFQNKIFPINTNSNSNDDSNNNNESLYFSKDNIQVISQTMSLFNQYGISTLFSLFVDQDDKNQNINVILLDQASLVLPSKEYYEDPKVLEKYKNGLNDILYKVLGHFSNSIEDSIFRIKASEKYGFHFWSQEKISATVDEFIAFEAQLANMSLKNEDLQDPIKLYNPIQLSEFQNKYPFMDWASIINSLIPSDSIYTPDTVIIRTPLYYERLNLLLSSNRVKLQTLQDYFIIIYVLNKVYTLDESSRAAYRKMNGEISMGTSVEQPRWRTCVSYTSSALSNSMGRYYALQKFGGEEERKKAEALLTTVHEAWLNRLPNIEWLDEQTRLKAIEKLNLIKHKVGYSIISPDLREPNSIKSYYEDLYVNKTSFYDTENNIAIWYVKKMWKKVGQEVDRDEWFMSPQTVNAYYSPNMNQIVIPAGILQPSFYNSFYPDYLNYGSIGMIIGHELTHAFDSSGRKFDGNGNLNNWWTNLTSTKFEEKTQCFIDQYSKFNTTGPDNNSIHINGKLTLGENLADNGGISASLVAYQKLVSNKIQQQQLLPGLEKLAPEALFFINFGRTWCKKQRPEIAYRMVFTDVHSPATARVNGVVQNNAEFAKIFHCPADSPMNPVNKCEIW